MLTWLTDSKLHLYTFLSLPSLRILCMFGFFFFHSCFKKKHNLESEQINFHKYGQKVSGEVGESPLHNSEAQHWSEDGTDVYFKIKKKKIWWEGKSCCFCVQEEFFQQCTGASVVDLPIFVLTDLEIFMQVSICR